jgi:predicted transposase YbfD/YdcC
MRVCHQVAVENALHWTPDVVFNEDGARVRKDNTGENMAIIRHITLNMLNEVDGGQHMDAIEYDPQPTEYLFKHG